jgi:hypothetical protein
MSEQGTSTSSRTARSAAALGSAGLAGALLGILGIQVGLLSPATGFYLFGAGSVLGGLGSLVLGLIGLVLTRGGGDPAGRRRTWIGCGCGALLLAAVVVGGAPGRGLPAINDITTDPGNPPLFTAATAEPANAGRDMGYPPEFAPIALEAYPDLASIVLPSSREDAYRRALAAAEELGWEISFDDPTGGAFEARDVSAIFRFVDDVRVRVRGGVGGAVIDLRSKSRDGRGDLGVNAERIRAFAAALREPPPVASE